MNHESEIPQFNELNRRPQGFDKIHVNSLLLLGNRPDKILVFTQQAYDRLKEFHGDQASAFLENQAHLVLKQAPYQLIKHKKSFESPKSDEAIMFRSILPIEVTHNTDYVKAFLEQRFILETCVGQFKASASMFGRNVILDLTITQPKSPI